MRRASVLALVVSMVLALAVAPSAFAGPDPHGHGGGSSGGGKPSPSPTAEPSPILQPTVAVEPSPTAGATSTGSPSAESSPAATPTDDAGAGANGSGGGSGIIKLDRQPFDQRPNNEPHVGCTFQMDFYNYPEGVTARYAFELWPPTGREDLSSGSVELQDDPSGGGQDLDGEETVELGPALLDSGAAPHQHNGWHVKLVVRARSTSGADQKQKVFWVRECREAAPTVSPTVEPTTLTPPPGPIAFTGTETMRLFGLMLLLLVLGSAALWLSARISPRRS